MSREKIIDMGIYASGCFQCIHLQQDTVPGRMYCDCRKYTDNTKIYPVDDFKRTPGWGACNLKDYKRESRIKPKTQKKPGMRVVDTTGRIYSLKG